MLGSGETAAAVREAVYNWTLTAVVTIVMVGLVLRFLGWTWHLVRKTWTRDRDDQVRGWGGGPHGNG